METEKRHVMKRILLWTYLINPAIILKQLLELRLQIHRDIMYLDLLWINILNP